MWELYKTEIPVYGINRNHQDKVAEITKELYAYICLDYETVEKDLGVLNDVNSEYPVLLVIRMAPCL